MTTKELLTEGWHDGSPPVVDDGSCVLVIFHHDATNGSADSVKGTYEYYGQPVVVSRWGNKLKTTVDPLRFDYEDVARWRELP